MIQADIADVSLFADWEKQMRPYPWTAAQFKSAHNPPWSHVLVWKRAAPIGFVVVQLDKPVAYISNIMIAPSMQGQGYGKKLFAFFERWCQLFGVEKIVLDVDVNNLRAIGFYKHCGFKIIDRRPHAYPKGEDALVMKKNLTEKIHEDS